MKTPFKLLIISVMTVLMAGILFGTTKAFLGNYIMHNPIMGSLILIFIIFLIYLFMKSVKAIWTLVLALGFFTMVSCNYAKSNQQVVVSSDCGMTWEKISAGDAVPKAGMNMCYMKVVIPNYPMQGDAIFVTNLREKVRANVHIDYDYSITEPLAFIKQAKFLGKANTDPDNEEALGKSFETAENTIIDKRIKDVAKEIFMNEDIVEVDMNELEDRLHTKVNEVLKPLGVYLNFITLTFDLDEQTRQAIDVSTAMKIYQSRGIQDVGKLVMAERAGATKITIENKTEAKTE